MTLIKFEETQKERKERLVRALAEQNAGHIPTCQPFRNDFMLGRMHRDSFLFRLFWEYKTYICLYTYDVVTQTLTHSGGPHTTTNATLAEETSLVRAYMMVMAGHFPLRPGTPHVNDRDVFIHNMFMFLIHNAYATMCESCRSRCNGFAFITTNKGKRCQSCRPFYFASIANMETNGRFLRLVAAMRTVYCNLQFLQTSLQRQIMGEEGQDLYHRSATRFRVIAYMASIIAL